MEQIRLENEQIEVTVNIHGAELRSLKSKADGQEYLWNADTKYWGRTSPVLFPFVGGVKNKVYRHATCSASLLRNDLGISSGK